MSTKSYDQIEQKKKGSGKARLVITGAALLVFVLVAYMVQTGRTASFDHAVDYAVYSLRGPVTNAFFSRFTHIGDGVCIVGFLAVLLILPRTRWPVGIPAAVTGAIGFGLYKILKTSFARPRPDSSLHLIQQGGYSFPSGHSMNVMICLGVVIFLFWRWMQRSEGVSRRTVTIMMVVLAALILGIGFSRIFVGVHFVTDVLGGWSMGFAYLLSATVIIDRVLEKKEVLNG
ncbi:phosphatase PAP2 family protein [Eubacterium sp. AB3007]|uniref:phosphatase PAP2 family protein n=1 Tax=Eubacterium sp. AB3007 TaxID=1392487 RepID=UPI00068F629E|nr:phosphatase PAP2 family protein [Eubacterium sp. AB3007]MBQ1471416.1 phosphatase PAP2 family protein [Eubacterium sp.]